MFKNKFWNLFYKLIRWWQYVWFHSDLTFNSFLQNQAFLLCFFDFVVIYLQHLNIIARDFNFFIRFFALVWVWLNFLSSFFISRKYWFIFNLVNFFPFSCRFQWILSVFGLKCWFFVILYDFSLLMKIKIFFII